VKKQTMMQQPEREMMGSTLIDEDPESSVDPEFILPAVDKKSTSKSFYPVQPWLIVL
jgi:hypothetical protein